MRTKWAKWVRWECHGRGHVGGYLEIKSWASKVIVGMPANKTGRSLNLSRERPDFLCRTKARSAISPEDSKVRYKACEAFINVAKVIRSGILEDMGAVFHGLCRQVRGLQVTCHEIFFFGNVYCCLYRYTCTCANYIYTSHIYIYIHMYSVYARAYSCRGLENSSLLYWAFIKNLRPTACQSPVKAS